MWGGYYCYNIELIREIKDGFYRIRNFLRGAKIDFLIAFDNDAPIIVAPLEWKKNVVSPIGVSEAFDFVDFFYRKDIDKKTIWSAQMHIFQFLEKSGIKNVIWKFVPEDSLSKVFLESMSIVEYAEIDNVRIPFGDYDKYIQSLSKSTRQNLRTAKNRIVKDAKHFSLITNYINELPVSTIYKCLSIYSKRQGSKYGKGFLNRISINTINYTTAMMRKNSGVIFVLEIDDKVAAFMFGYINLVKNSIEIPKLAIDENYAFYSPGMLLVDQTIEYLQKNTNIRTLDLCRGTENYKLKMGGEIYKTYNFTIKL